MSSQTLRGLTFRQFTEDTALLLSEDYPAFSFSHAMDDFDPAVFTEEKECNESERVICKGTSTRRELKKLPNRAGYKARKEFWR